MFEALLDPNSAFGKIIAGISDEQLIGTAICFIIAMAWMLLTLIGSNSAPVALSATEFRSFELEKIEQVSPDTKLLRFKLQSKLHQLGLPTGQHISFRCKDKNGEMVMRSYTPISSNDDIGYVEFVIKIYFPNVHPKFPDGGVMTMYLEELKVGDKVEMRGPKGHLDYKGCGKYTIQEMNKKTGKRSTQSYNNKHFGFVAGGSGITPCLQVIREILKNDSDTSDIWLLYANKSESDILLKKELEKMKNDNKNRFHLYYTLDEPPKRGWKGGKGFINTEMCEKALPECSDDTFIFICGPPPMIKFAVEPSLKEMGYKENQWFAF